MTDRFSWRIPAFMLAALAVATAGYKASRPFLTTEYQTAGLVLLAAGFALILDKKWVPKLRPVYFLFFLPIWLMPAIRCRFMIPYVFCGVCPGRCGWGESRSMFLPFYLLLNVDSRFWCWSLCPLGQTQDAVPKTCDQTRPPACATYVRFAVLAFAAAVIYGWLSYTYRVYYEFSAVSAVILLSMIALSPRIPRVFCRTLCPIGAFSDVILWLRKRTGV